MTRAPDFDDLVGKDVPDEERARLLQAHRLLVEAGPPPELSPEMDSVPWPEDSQMPLVKPKQRRPILLAAAIATAIGIGFVLGQSTSSSSSSSSMEAVRVVQLADDVPPGSIAGFAPRQVTKEGYVYDKHGRPTDD